MNEFDPSAELYCLFLNHRVRESVRVGAHGEIHWSEGWTVYVGRSSYGWTSRLKRLAGPKAPTNRHWHVDYLIDRPTSRLELVVPVAESGSRECDLADWFDRSAEVRVLSEGFGASDCEEGCGAHAFSVSDDATKLLADLGNSTFNVRGAARLGEASCRWFSPTAE